MFTMLLAIAVLSLGPPIAQETSPQVLMSVPPAEVEPYIEIDGANTPALIPDYVVWREGFRALRSSSKQNVDPALLGLNVPKQEKAAIINEAERQGVLEDQCYERQNRSKASLLPRGVPFEKVPLKTRQTAQAANRPIIMEYRRQIVAGRDRLLEALSPETAVALTQWMESHRHGIRMFVSKSDFESGHYRESR